jgi:hydrogenase-4 component B
MMSLVLPLAVAEVALGYIDLPQLLLGARVGLDVPGRAFLLVSLLLWGAMFVGYWPWWRSDPRTLRWGVATFVGHLVVHVALDAATFQLGFALMGLASYGMIMARRTPEADAAALRYLAFVVVGEVLLFAGLSLVYGGAESGAATAMAAAMRSAPYAPAAMSLVVLALGIKSAVIPLHGWLPAAYVAAPLPVRVILAGAMINAGVLGWLRFLPMGAAEAAFLVAPVAVLGLLGASYGALRGALASDARRALAYSSVSQMGMVTVGLAAALGMAEGAVPAIVLYGTHHGLVKGTLFLGLGLIAVVVDASRRRSAVALCALAALVLIGAPFTSGAAAKGALKGVVGVLPAPLGQLFGVVATVVLVGTTVIVVRLVVALWRGTVHDDQAPAATAVTWALWLGLVGAVLSAVWWAPALVRL